MTIGGSSGVGYGVPTPPLQGDEAGGEPKISQNFRGQKNISRKLLGAPRAVNDAKMCSGIDRRELCWVNLFDGVHGAEAGGRTTPLDFPVRGG